MKVKVLVTPCVWHFVTLWTEARQAPLSMELSSGKTTGLVAISFFRGYHIYVYNIYIYQIIMFYIWNQ